MPGDEQSATSGPDSGRNGTGGVLFDQLQPYLRRLVGQVQNLDLFRLRRVTGGIPFPVDQVVVPLRLLERDLRTGSRPGEEWDDPHLRYRPEGRPVELDTVLSELFAVDSHRSLVVIGKPGAGKTTLLRYLAYYHAERRQSEISRSLAPRIPFYLRLKDTAAELTALPELADVLAGAEIGLDRTTVARCLAAGALVLLDGMDEVADQNQRAVVGRWLQQAVRNNAQSWFVISSRAAGFDPDYAPVGTLTVQVEDFDEDQRREFLYRWFRHVRSADRGASADWDANVIADGLARRIETHSGLRDLAHNPLLLSIIALLCHSHLRFGRQDLDAALPVSRVELYRRCVQLFIDEWWDVCRAVPVTNPGRDNLEQVLKQAAFALQTRAERRDRDPQRLNKSALVEALSATLPLDTAQLDACLGYSHERSLLLVEHALDNWGFQHKTFQEYLCACHLTECIAQDKEQSGKEAKEILVDNLGRDHWRVVWELFLEANIHADGTSSPELDSILTAAGQRCENDPDYLTRAWDWLEELHDAGDFVYPTPERRRLQHIAWKFCAGAEPLYAWSRAHDFAARGLDEDIVSIERYRQRIVECSTDPTVLTRLLLLGADLFPKAPQELLVLFESWLDDAQPPSIRSAAALVLERWDYPDRQRLDAVLFVPIPAGEFYRGGRKEDDPSTRDNEFDGKRHRLDAYEIGCYPVTNAEYRRFVEATDHEPPEHWREGAVPLGRDNHPVVEVSWYDANDYVEWLNERDDDHDYALPTEAQWERAARGPAEVDGKENRRIYPWGDEFDPHRCNVRETGLDRTTAVGCFPDGASPNGVLDLSGNVWEWCLNEYRDPERTDPSGSGHRVVRGGSWLGGRGGARAACRSRFVPGDRFDGLGFRVVRRPPS